MERSRCSGVTVLTSMSVPDVEAAWGRKLGSLRDEVVRLAGMAKEERVWGGVVASPMEARPLKRLLGSDLLVVTPGIRLGDDDHHDQARFARPTEAADAGAHYLVVGRSITRAPDPVEALALVRDQAEPPSGSQDGAHTRRAGGDSDGLDQRMRAPRLLLVGFFVALGIPSSACLGQSLEEAASTFARLWAAERGLEPRGEPLSGLACAFSGRRGKSAPSIRAMRELRSGNTSGAGKASQPE